MVDDDDQARRGSAATRRPAQEAKQQKQLAQRGGFSVPPAGERRFVSNEVLLNIPAATLARAVDAIARKHRLTRLDVQDFT